jgi:hypothetical protein
MAKFETRNKIIEYLKYNLKKGYTIDSLKWALIRQGYSRTMIEFAIKDLNKELSKQAPVLKEKPKITYEIIDEFDKPIKIKNPWWKFF